MTFRSLIAALALTLGAAPAVADEVWSSDIGYLIYETDIEPYAVISFPGDGPGDSNADGAGLEDGERYMAFIDNLAYNYDKRSRHGGYWTGPDGDSGEGCEVPITNHMGETTHNWGRIDVIFVESGFPSAFIAQRGFCFDDPLLELVAQPVTADDEIVPMDGAEPALEE